MTHQLLDMFLHRIDPDVAGPERAQADRAPADLHQPVDHRPMVSRLEDEGRIVRDLREDFFEAFCFRGIGFEGGLVDAGDEEVAVCQDAAEERDADGGVC